MKDNDKIVNDGRINYDSLLRKYPWLIADNQKVIISPDVDGILCGLFLSSYNNWEVVGYYDGKQLAIKENIKQNDCVFIDIEIYRENIKSAGHHIVLYNKKHLPSNWNNFSNCVNPNIIRNHDAYNDFQEKYPLAMIHFLLCVISSQKKISISESAISPLLYVDGTFKNLLNYPENCVNWLKFFDAKSPSSPIYPVYLLFANRKLSDMIHDLESIFGKFKDIADGKRGGDKFKVSDVQESYGYFTYKSVTKIERLINLLSNLIGWEYYPDKWTLKELNIFNYSKGIEEKLNNKKYIEIINQNPISFAITATKRIEYTLEKPDKF